MTADLIASKYEIIREIASGGMGTVFEARHVEIGKRVALKRLRSDLASHPRYLERFRREARAAGALQHENIAIVFDAFIDLETPVIIMEFVDGQSLRALIQHAAPFSPQRSVQLILQAAWALGAAHAQGIVHRDLKPENIMLCCHTDGSDWVKVLDFGIARISNASSEFEATTTGAVMGTAHYMSPEQARGERNITEQTDVYALAAILYELLSGEKAHPGESYNATIYHVLSKDVDPLDALRPSLPRELVRAVHRGLAKDRDARFSSVEEFARQIKPFSGAASAQPLESHVDTAVSFASSSTASRGRMSRLWIRWSAASAALATGFILGWLARSTAESAAEENQRVSVDQIGPADPGDTAVPSGAKPEQFRASPVSVTEGPVSAVNTASTTYQAVEHAARKRPKLRKSGLASVASARARAQPPAAEAPPESTVSPSNRTEAGLIPNPY